MYLSVIPADRICLSITYKNFSKIFDVNFYNFIACTISTLDEYKFTSEYNLLL